ncbi:MAG TPA: DUF423 domain-containing protein [Candidatus Competibacteraceae bacterium]|nr:DUF423 domain-containing protein [Candidatus Competibacteraceae bacterium]MCP5132803.1 DUF423 domain-containing protein [Gammaproteobacteria bacterium]HPF57567.1 DUF423 domain-containing protein [Candidatus Competibacteraceae bacterium]HRY16912.1 DUF423 domain-containing protein [Candidatus Competibacteraceae bacterium]
MPVWTKVFLLLGCVGMLCAVAMGAFGAHALKKVLAPDLMAVYETAVHYHVYHALGLLAVGLLTWRLPESVALRGSGLLMTGGLLLFSGSLYALALSGIRWLGAITPIGGVAFLAAWLLLAIAVVRAS